MKVKVNLRGSNFSPPLAEGVKLTSSCLHTLIDFKEKEISFSFNVPQLRVSLAYELPYPSTRLFVEMHSYLIGELEPFMMERGWREYDTNFTHRDIVSIMPTQLTLSYIPHSFEGEVTVPTSDEILKVMSMWGNIVAAIFALDAEYTANLSLAGEIFPYYRKGVIPDEMDWRDEMSNWTDNEWLEFAIEKTKEDMEFSDYVDDMDEFLLDWLTKRKGNILVDVVSSSVMSVGG